MLVPTERPLTSRLVIDRNPESTSDLTAIVEETKIQLQMQKKYAWTETPVFQLCQLFRTKSAEEGDATDSHLLVGQHFGQLVAGDGKPSSLFTNLQRSEAENGWKDAVSKWSNQR
eukprot:scaffold37676_cov52-Attheya_sp.AAC.1